MEHRLSERRPSDLELILKRSGKSDLTAQAHDIAQDGMFICVAGGCLRQGEMFDVEFALEKPSGAKRYSQKAWVVHCSDEGVGVMFIAPPALCDKEK